MIKADTLVRPGQHAPGVTPVRLPPAPRTRDEPSQTATTDVTRRRETPAAPARARAL